MEFKPKKFLHVYSGGLDSTVLLYDLLSQGNTVTCVNFQYGSKHNGIEYYFASLICQIKRVPLVRVSMPEVFSCTSSSLIRHDIQIPEGYYTDKNMKSTVVPFRNGVFLSIAASMAEAFELDAISYAAHSGDHAIYPDCRQSFVNAIREAIQLGTYKRIQTAVPYLTMSKTDIVKRGAELNVPFEKTWTCYNGDYEKGHCGKCGACVERKEAFQLSGVNDPTIYKS